MSLTEQSTETGSIARAYFEAVGARDLDAMTGFYEPGGTGEIHGLVELVAPVTYRAWFANLFQVVPDLRMEIEEIVAEGDKVWARSIARGVEPDSGNELVFTVFDVCRFADGRIVEHWGVPDRFALLDQLGVLPAPPQG